MEQDRNLRDDAMPLSARILTYGAFAVATFALMFCMAHAAPAQIALPSGSDPIVPHGVRARFAGQHHFDAGGERADDDRCAGTPAGNRKRTDGIVRAPDRRCAAADTDMRAVVDARGIKLKITW